MKNKFLSVSIGVAMMLLGAGFFIRSFYAVNAAPTSKNLMQQETNKIGKYQACLTDYSGIHALIINTETGETKYYILHNIGWSSLDMKQIPANPFSN
jgi:hypothetical protein